jgi:hypothetical protein
MVSTGVNEVSTFTECAKEKRSEDAHAEYCPEYGVLGRFNVCDVANLRVERK